MKKSKYSEELAVAKHAAREAGKILMKRFGKQSKKQMKGKFDFYLDADVEAEKAIIKILKNRYPEHAILAEESGKQGNSAYTWIIDPLDGTHNYAHGVPVFGTSIALQHKKDVVIGVIYLPVMNELYYAEKGRGAFLNDRRIHVKNKDGLIVFGGTHRFRSSIVSKSMMKVINKYHHKLRFLGSAVFASVNVAIGHMSAYITFYINAWDIAAGALIVEESGGKVTDINGKKWDLNKKHLVLSNRRIHEEILRVLK